MAEYPLITEVDGVTPAAFLSFTVEGGDVSANYSYKLVNDPDGHPDAETIEGYLQLQAFDGEDWVTQGVPMLDERWVSVAVTDYLEGSDPMLPQETGTIPLGTGRVIHVLPITPTGNRTIVVSVKPPGNTDPQSVQWRLTFVTREHVLGLVGKLELVGGTGVVPGYREPSYRRVAFGQLLTADSTDVVVITGGAVDYDGFRSVMVDEEVTLDQDASDGALGVGEYYLAVISRSPAMVLTVTKGAGDAAPVEPATPDDHVYLGTVTVAQGASSVIAPEDVDVSRVLRGDYYVEAGAGTTVTIRPGEGLASDTYAYDTASNVVAVAEGSNFIWKNPSGTASSTATETPPEFGSILLAEVEVTGGVISSMLDRRRILSLPATLYVKEVTLFDVWSESEVDAKVGNFMVIPEDLELDEVTVDLDSLDALWTAGALQFDVLYWPRGTSIAAAGTSVFTDSATDDRRPTVAFDATELRSSSKYIQARRHKAGTRFAIVLTAKPTSSAPEDAHEVVISLLFRRTR